MVNVYEHFGRSDLWPRGYPLAADLQRPSATLGYLDNETYVGELNGRALVQQSLIDIAPDVDSLSITMRAETSRIERLCSTAPALQLARGAMVPIGAKHMLWHRDAFWALLLPASAPPGWSDIVRGCVGAVTHGADRQIHRSATALGRRRHELGQLYLREACASLAESIELTRQVSTSPRSTSIDELQTAQRVGHMVAALHTWTSDEPALPERIIGLTSAMRSSGHLSRKDGTLARAWLADLVQLRYAFPSVVPWSSANAEAARLATPQPALATSLAASHIACASEKVSFDDTLLVIVWNSPLYQYLDRFVRAQQGQRR